VRVSSPLRSAVATLCLLLAASIASAQMPDMKQMSGIPRPVSDLPDGSVSVRLIRGDMSNAIVGHPVEMHAGEKVQTVNTDAEGRARFDNLTPGTQVRFTATVDGERLESQEFPAQAQGGVRLLLVATDKSAGAGSQKPAEPGPPAVSGAVTIGGDSRIIIEPAEDTISVYYVLEIINAATGPVNPERPFVFTLPAAAVSPTVIQGSSPLASGKGHEVTVAGPFPPGTTAVQVAAEYPIGNGTVEISQAFPAHMQQLIVLAKRVGSMTLTSPQLSRTQDSVIEGTPVSVGMGKELAAGQPLTLTVSGLPHHSSTPRTIALLLAVGIIVLGAWATVRHGRTPADDAGERKRLIARRERLFQDLVRLEHDQRRGRVDPARYSTRREELLQALEHIYGALEEGDAGPEPARRAGVAA